MPLSNSLFAIVVIIFIVKIHLWVLASSSWSSRWSAGSASGGSDPLSSGGPGFYWAGGPSCQCRAWAGESETKMARCKKWISKYLAITHERDRSSTDIYLRGLVGGWYLGIWKRKSWREIQLTERGVVKVLTREEIHEQSLTSVLLVATVASLNSGDHVTVGEQLSGVLTRTCGRGKLTTDQSQDHGSHTRHNGNHINTEIQLSDHTRHPDTRQVMHRTHWKKLYHYLLCYESISWG